MGADPARVVLTHPSPGLLNEAHEMEKSCVEEQRAAQRVTLSVDLVLAAKRHLGLLRSIDSLPCLHRGPAVTRAIQRYENYWLPLVADAMKFDALLNSNAKGSKTLMPPIDVQWIWLCHCLNPLEYRKYCSRKYGRVIDYPILPDVASEASAQERCKKLWAILYPKEPFDILASLCKLPGSSGKSGQIHKDVDGSELVRELVPIIDRQSSFYYQVSQPYMWEEVFLRAARERYKCFLHLLRKSNGKILCVPTFDIDLMWHAHQQVPVAYGKDSEAVVGCVVDHQDNLERGPGTKLGNGFEDTARLWENTFGHPYEKAGTLYRGSKPVNLPAPPASEVTGSTQVLERVPVILPWDFRSKDENVAKYPVLSPRHVSEVCVAIKGNPSILATKGKESAGLFVRLKALESCKLLKVDAPVGPLSNEPQWQKLWSLQCEAKTKGVVLELRHHVDGCLRSLRKTKRLGGTKIMWQELQKTPMLSQEAVVTLGKKRLQIRLGVSMTPPVQGSYLLKSVPDRVTDDKGQMLSSAIVRMRRNQPQSGRWVSRTVLNHAGKESFVIRIRAAKGIWKKNGERPVGVDWNERVINVHEGGWNYIAHGTGIAPEKIVGSATPLAHELEEYKLSWSFSTGDTLIISRQMGDLDWERHLEFTLRTSGPSAGVARLVNGRKLQYEVAGATSEEEDGFVTLIRYTPQSPQGRATALFNFKISVMEVVPEEDVLLVLLLCTATLRSIADFGGLTSGNVYTRRRAKENRPGLEDWGSVVLENGSNLSHLTSWHVKSAAFSDDEDDGDGEKLPGRVAADWGGDEASMPRSIAGSMRLRYLPPAAAVAHDTSAQATTGMWGRRAGSGVQVDSAHLR